MPDVSVGTAVEGRSSAKFVSAQTMRPSPYIVSCLLFLLPPVLRKVIRLQSERASWGKLWGQGVGNLDEHEVARCALIAKLRVLEGESGQHAS